MTRPALAIAAALIFAMFLAVGMAQVTVVPGEDVLILALLSGGAATATGALGAYALRRLHRGSIAQQALVVALTPLVATAVGAALAARAMFVSSHDLAALLVVLAAAGGVGVAAGLALAGRLGAGARQLAELAEQMGSGAGRVPDLPLSRELAALSEQLETTSARLTAATARERALDASRRELVAWVSHDLRTPVAGIRAMAEALADGLVEGDDVARYHQTLGVEAERLSGLVDDLFELSRIESSALRLSLERVSLGEVVSSALAGAAPVARAKGVHLDSSLHEPVPVVEVGAAELSRVVRNLLENAIRHTPADRAVLLEAGRDDQAAFITVLDSCGGIPDDDLDRVFDVAFRGDAARTPAGGAGAGLGLAIARGLVDAHHGQITVRNESGGCRFTVRLPLP